MVEVQEPRAIWWSKCALFSTSKRVVASQRRRTHLGIEAVHIIETVHFNFQAELFCPLSHLIQLSRSRAMIDGGTYGIHNLLSPRHFKASIIRSRSLLTTGLISKGIHGIFSVSCSAIANLRYRYERGNWECGKCGNSESDTSTPLTSSFLPTTTSWFLLHSYSLLLPFFRP